MHTKGPPCSLIHHPLVRSTGNFLYEWFRDEYFDAKAAAKAYFEIFNNPNAPPKNPFLGALVASCPSNAPDMSLVFGQLMNLHSGAFWQRVASHSGAFGQT